ncbi:hypothetical protein SAMN05216268_11586 [Streptomyces yunnanensis]|uniref:Uncharacterized protein n=1 Tax=Streptomyces yunnanensis TaxID=156453 RepID=A0A9X8N3K1_9ACTN|nr:hypothetical protein SAMN05216268_11586 [Streptomyces yunnanensis]
MTERKRGTPGSGVGAAVPLALPASQPNPVEDCAACGALAVQRKAAAEQGDLSAVTDANVRLRNHRSHSGSLPWP